MGQTSENIAKKSENNSTPIENWLQKAFNLVPKGEVKNKITDICEACGCTNISFYRWKRTGRVPNKMQRDKICEILNFDLKTLKTKES